MANTQAPECADITQFQAATKIVLAPEECHPKLKAAALKLFRNLQSGEMDDYQTHAACALLTDILFPNAPGGDAPHQAAVTPVNGRGRAGSLTRPRTRGL